MELLIPLAFALVGVVTLAVSIRLMVRGPQPKKAELARAERIALETARLEAENKRLETEYETDRNRQLDSLDNPDTSWEAEIRKVRANLERALFLDSLERAQTSDEAMRLIQHNSMQISNTFRENKDDEK